MSKFKDQFNKEIIKKLMDRLSIKNPMGVPRVVKVVVNASNKEFLTDKKNIERARSELTLITGQAPKTSKARISVATFKLREGDEIGLTITLRGARMYDFLERLIKIVFPRVKDFSGVNPKSFDGRGNLSVGFSESTVFPEIDPGTVDRVRGLQIILATNAGQDAPARALFEELGMQFRKN